MTRRIINAPSDDVLKMLERRMPHDTRVRVREHKFDAIGLVQTSVPNLFYYADIAQKASNVLVVEISGTCPQHISVLAFFGETSAVEIAMQAIEERESLL